jgi:hypothetical protein
VVTKCELRERIVPILPGPDLTLTRPSLQLNLSLDLQSEMRVLVLAALAGSVRADPPVRAYNVEWLSLTPFDGKAYTDGMPSGNGHVQVLAWGNATTGGLSFYVRSPLAMHTDSALYTIARVDVSVSPNPVSLHGASGRPPSLALHTRVHACSF